MMSPDRVLERSVGLIVGRIAQLEDRVQQGDETLWAEYRQMLDTLTKVLDHVAPGRRGELLTTAEMAARLNVSPKTLLRRKAKGDVQPMVQRGRFIRWKGDEIVR